MFFIRKELIGSILLLLLLLSGCVQDQGDDNWFCAKQGSEKAMSFDRAIEIANVSECVAQGQLKENFFCNTFTGTIWIDLEIEKQGCSPACVVDVETETAEINWRCTGVIASEEKIGPVADSIVFKKVSPENAVAAIASGEIDYYLGSILPKEAIDLQDETIVLVQSPSIMNGILINPAPSLENRFNPFYSQKARFALNFLIDRSLITETVHQGFGYPAFTNIFKNHPLYEKSKSVVETFSLEFDKNKGEMLLAEGLEGIGAEKVEGKWKFQDKNITVKIYSLSFIREMKETAEIVASVLENEGFEVETVLTERDVESPVYYSDPSQLEWNISIVSWIYYNVDRYPEVSFPEISESEGWWKYENAEKEAVKEKLSSGQYNSAEEWESLMWALAEIELEDSVGLWLTNQQTIFAAKKDLSGIVKDDFVGLRNYTTIRKAKMPDKPGLKIGMAETYFDEDPWNPLVISGIQMMDITNALHDPALYSSQTSRNKERFRWGFEIDSRKEDEIIAPENSFVWSVEEKKWVDAAGARAKTKVTYDLSNYIGSKWHHSQEISWADILFFVASLWDKTFDEEKILTDDAGFWYKDTFKEIVAIRIEGNFLEVYLNKWHFSSDGLTGFAGIFQRIAPWEIYAGADKLVFEDKTFSYSKESAEKTGAKPLSLIKEEHTNSLIDSLKTINFESLKPLFEAGGKSYAEAGDLLKRIAALEQWKSEKNHLIISDGPFYLERYDSTTGEIELNAFRDKSYPIKWGLWNTN